MIRSMSERRRRAGAVRDTGERLIDAATAEFCEHGYFGTDSNKIARRAGFAPQTFYRWFADKTEIFIKVYDRWIEGEFAAAQSLIDAGAGDAALIASAISFHSRYRIFRRSLRQLSLEDPRIRAARAASRRQQIRQLRAWSANPALGEGEIAVFLLEHERLCDALAEGEFADLGLDDSAALARLGQMYRELRPART
jgi:AcrR family transcriptional regulator